MSTSCTTEPLAERIAAFDAELSKKAPANVLEAVRAAIADIVRGDAGRERSAPARLRRPSPFQTRGEGTCHCTTCSSAAPW